MIRSFFTKPLTKCLYYRSFQFVPLLVDILNKADGLPSSFRLACVEVAYQLYVPEVDEMLSFCLLHSS